MRLINLEESIGEGVQKAPRYTFCVYGSTGSGKTTFAASLPRPAFLSDVSESGYESLRGISDEALFEPGVKPIILGIEKMNDMNVAREAITPHIMSGMIQTVVIDSLTFYADLYLNYLFMMFPSNNLKAYGALGQHLQDVRVKTHGLGCNVVTLCLPQDPHEDSPYGLPSIPGKQASKFGAGCDFILYTTHDRIKSAAGHTDNFGLHSKPVGKFIARARRAVGMPELASPLVNTDYAGFIMNLGYDADATRAALPEYKNPSAAIQAFIDGAVRAAPPPVTQAAPVQQVRSVAPIKPHVPTAARPANGRPQLDVTTRRPTAVPPRPTGSGNR